MYWKVSKTMVDQLTPHVENSIFANDQGEFSMGGSCTRFNGPAGPFTFYLRNVSFAGACAEWLPDDPAPRRHATAPVLRAGNVGDAALSAGQHCGLDQERAGKHTMCNAQYLLEAVEWRNLRGGFGGLHRIRFGVSGGNNVVPSFSSPDGSLGGYRSVVSGRLSGFAKVAGCQPAGELYFWGIGCDSPMRRLDVWAPNNGCDCATCCETRIHGPGFEEDLGLADYSCTSGDSCQLYGMNAGLLRYDHIWGDGGQAETDAPLRQPQR